MGSFEFTPPYQDGWQDNEEGATPITADILNNNYDSFLLTLNNWITSVEGLFITVPENITTQVMTALAGLYGELAIENPTSGQVLKFNGSKWVNANESGGGGGGSTVSWQQILQTGTKIGTITIDGMSYDVYAPTPPANTSDLTNDSNFVADSSYVHTDNNYTTTEKNKLADLNQVEANPSSGTSAGNLNSIKIGGTKYDIPSGGGSGTNVEWTQIVQSGTKIAEIEIDGNTTDVYAPTSGGGYTEVTGTLTAGQTSITLSSSAITSNSTFEMFNDLDVPYNSKALDTTTTPPSITYTFDAQQSDMSVKVRVS